MGRRSAAFKLLLNRTAAIPQTRPLAPRLGIPTGANPPVVPAFVPADMVAGMIAKLKRSLDPTFASGVIVGTPYTFTGSETPGATITGFGTPTLSGGPWFFQSTDTLAGVESNPSNTVGWGTAAASFASTASVSIAELTPLSFAAPSAGQLGAWSIAGGADQLQFSIDPATGAITWFNNGTQNYDAPTTLNGTQAYVVIRRFTNSGGLTTDQTVTVTVTQVTKQPTFTPSTFTSVTNATHGVDYTTGVATTVSGLASGLNIPATIANGFYSKNGGSFINTSPLTMTNGDTFSLRGQTTGTTIVTLTGSPGIHAGSISFTISDGAAQLANSGIDYCTDLTLSGTPRLTYLTNGGSGATGMVRLNRAASGPKTHVELHATSWTGNLAGAFGVDVRTDDFSTPNAGGPIPGYTDSTGCVLLAYIGIWANTQGTQIAVTQPSNGDVIAMEWDATNIWFYNATLGTLLGTTAHGLGTAALWLFVGQSGGGTNIGGTLNVTGPYVMTPTAGFGNY